MKRKIHILLLAVGCLLISLGHRATAQELQVDSLRVYFQQGKDRIYDHTLLPGVSSEELCREVKALLAKEDSELIGIEIYAGASPEAAGGAAFNRVLSERRGEYVKALLLKELQIDPQSIHINPLGVDWTMLHRLVEASDMPYKKEVLWIIDNSPETISRNGKVQDLRHEKLKVLRDGAPWRYMYRHFYPLMRSALVTMNYLTKAEPAVEQEHVVPAVVEEVPAVVEETPAVVEEVPAVVEETPATPSRPSAPSTRQEHCLKGFYALKSNLLYDVALLPNIGAEIYLDNGYSLSAEWMYGWWDNHSSWWWRAYGGDVELRKWFGKRANEKPLTGHHIGLYGQMLTYDVQLGKGHKGNLGTKWSYGVGLSYGYSLPIARRLNLDFNVGFGYFRGKYYEYISPEMCPYCDCYQWQATKNRRWIGPTKAAISLVWLIGCDNYNEKTR